MKKNYLSVSEQEIQGIFVGIHSFLDIYRLAYFLNKQFLLQLVRYSDYFPENQHEIGYPLYQCLKDYEERWTLIANKIIAKSVWGGMFQVQETSFLIKEYKKADYVLKIENASEQFSQEDLLLNLRQIPQIQYVYLIDFNKLKSKHKLLF